MKSVKQRRGLGMAGLIGFATGILFDAVIRIVLTERETKAPLPGSADWLGEDTPDWRPGEENVTYG